MLKASGKVPPVTRGRSVYDRLNTWTVRIRTRLREHNWEAPLGKESPTGTSRETCNDGILTPSPTWSRTLSHSPITPRMPNLCDICPLFLQARKQRGWKRYKHFVDVNAHFPGTVAPLASPIPFPIMCGAAQAQTLIGHQQQDGMALKWASVEMKGDRELCTAAVAQDWHAQHSRRLQETTCPLSYPTLR